MFCFFFFFSSLYVFVCNTMRHFTPAPKEQRTRTNDCFGWIDEKKNTRRVPTRSVLDASTRAVQNNPNPKRIGAIRRHGGVCPPPACHFILSFFFSFGSGLDRESTKCRRTQRKKTETQLLWCESFFFFRCFLLLLFFAIVFTTRPKPPPHTHEMGFSLSRRLEREKENALPRPVVPNAGSTKYQALLR